ncbi:MAG TPA: glycerol kinase GlpK [Solirubrobacteraceae bacterium]
MILAIDQGTTGTTCIVFDEQAQELGRAQGELAQHFPRPGWVEHDAGEIWALVRQLASEALEDAQVRPGELLAIGITNQRETVCAWDRESGEPLSRAIVWQDRRTAKRCEELRSQGVEQLIRQRTGLLLDPYFSATKMQWLLDNVDGLRERAQTGRALLGTVDAWLIFKLTGEHRTDASNASRTLLCDIASGQWDSELLELFGVPAQALPSICDSAGPLGTVVEGALPGVAPGTPVTGVAGDQQAALFGQGCVDPGMAKSTYGTGSFVLLNSGFTAPPPANGVIGTLAWSIGGGRSYATETSIFATGAAVQWLRDGLRIIGQADETEALASSLQDNEGVYFVPALTGLGSPHWDPEARGTIVGLTRGSGREHIARATLEAIAYQVHDAVRAMEAASKQPLSELRADGGATANRWLMQFQADILGVPVLVPEVAETTAFGAALLAGVGASLWTVNDVGSFWQERARYEPSMPEERRRALLDGWSQALRRTLTEPPARNQDPAAR